MENFKDASQIAVLVIALVGFIKPFIPEEKADIIPGIAILLGAILGFSFGADVMAVVDGVMGSMIGVATYKIGSTKLKGKAEAVAKKQKESGVGELIELLKQAK